MANRFRDLYDALIRRGRFEREMEDELRDHIDRRTEDLIREGMSPENARRRARVEFGAGQARREECREARGFRPFDEAAQDARYSLRSLRRHPAFAAVAILSVALGIGANTAIFSLLNAVALKSLPVAAPGELFALRWSDPKTPQRFSWPTFERFHAAVPRTPMTASTRITSMNVVIGGSRSAETASGQLVSGEYFDVLGLHPALGRLLTPDDNRTVDGHPLAVISHGYWERRFASSPAAIGQDVTLNGTHFTIIGVGPPGFSGVWADAPADVWIPVMMQSAVHYAGNRSSHNGDDEKPWPPQEQILWLDIVARIPRDQATARAHLGVAFQQELTRVANLYGGDVARRRAVFAQHLDLEPCGRGFSTLRKTFSKPLAALLVMVGLVLLIACANVANLLLARASGRRQEVSVRLSIGAGRWRLVRQFLTESALLAVLGALLGLLVAKGAMTLLVGQVFEGAQAIPISITPDLRVISFTLGLTLITTMLFGLFPAIRGTDVELSTAMKAGGRTTHGSARSGGMKLLVASQVALSLVVLVASGVFARSFRQLLLQDRGFDRENVIAVFVNPKSAGFTEGQLPALYRTLVERIDAVPGVRSAAVAENGLVSGSESHSGVEIAGYPKRPDEEIQFQVDSVGLNYFGTVGMRLLEGRDFTWRDNEHAPKVAIVNETLARRYFPGRSALGQRFGDNRPDTEIVGVVVDSLVNDVHKPVPTMAWYPIAQQPDFIRTILVRAAGNSTAVESQLRSAIAQAAPALPVRGIRTLEEQIRSNLVEERLMVQLTAAFGALALLLAAVGLYGVMAYSVARRTSEFGIRMALGARREEVLWKIIGESSLIVGIGLACGLPLMLGAMRLVSSMLFGVSAADPLTVLAAAAVLVVVALFAVAIPAVRASRVDPMVALRYE